MSTLLKQQITEGLFIRSVLSCNFLFHTLHATDLPILVTTEKIEEFRKIVLQVSYTLYVRSGLFLNSNLRLFSHFSQVGSTKFKKKEIKNYNIFKLTIP